MYSRIGNYDDDGDDDDDDYHHHHDQNEDNINQLEYPIPHPTNGPTDGRTWVLPIG